MYFGVYLYYILLLINLVIRSYIFPRTLISMFYSAGFYTETITLNFSAFNWPTRIECRAFLTDDSIVPCCDTSNHKSLCQPDTGIARVIVDIVTPSDNASLVCKPGVDLNSALRLNDKCPLNGRSKYCRMNSLSGP